jgi:hypothetical protein
MQGLGLFTLRQLFHEGKCSRVLLVSTAEGNLTGDL